MYNATLFCTFCEKSFTSKRKNASRFCSQACRSKAQARAYREANPSSGLDTGTRGALSELTACCDLLQKGYEVFRSVSQSCSCDLAILKDGKLLRIEVRTGHWAANGKLIYSQSKKDVTRSDHYAVVTNRGVLYIPPLPST